MDERYIKVKRKWIYLYRAVDNHGKTIDFMLSQRRNKTAARRIFRHAIEAHGVPNRIVIDKSGAQHAPREIERALAGAGLEEEPRPLALEARAHVIVQRAIDEMYRNNADPHVC